MGAPLYAFAVNIFLLRDASHSLNVFFSYFISRSFLEERAYFSRSERHERRPVRSGICGGYPIHSIGTIFARLKAAIGRVLLVPGS